MQSKFSITAGKKDGSALSSNLSRSVSEEAQFVGSKSKRQDDEKLNKNDKMDEISYNEDEGADDKSGDNSNDGSPKNEKK